MDSIENFEQNRRVVEDFTASALARIPSDLGKLAYLSGLRDPSTGRYRHAQLAKQYSESVVHQALALCHGEVFERILETPLERQERDLRLYLAALSGPNEVDEQGLREESYRTMMPLEAPAYLQELFLSNMKMLLRLISDPPAGCHPTA